MGRTVGGVLVTLVIIGIVVYSKVNRRNEAEADILENMQVLTAKLDVYPANKDYLDELLEREHKQAFDSAYDMGGRRRGSKFDWDKYAAAVFDGMCKQSARDKKPDLVKSLRSFEQLVVGATKSEKSTAGSTGG